MNLNNVYLGSIFIITNKYKDEVHFCIARDIKFYKFAIILKYKYFNNIGYEDLKTGEFYYSSKLLDIGNKFVNEKCKLTPLSDIVGKKYMTKRKVLRRFEQELIKRNKKVGGKYEENI